MYTIIQSTNNQFRACNEEYFIEAYNKIVHEDLIENMKLVNTNMTAINKIDKQDNTTLLLINTHNNIHEIASYIVITYLSNNNNTNRVLFIEGIFTSVSYRRLGLSTILVSVVSKYALLDDSIVGICLFAVSQESASLFPYLGFINLREDLILQQQLSAEFGDFMDYLAPASDINYSLNNIPIYNHEQYTTFINKLNNTFERISQCMITLKTNQRAQHGGYEGKYHKYKQKYMRLKNK